MTQYDYIVIGAGIIGLTLAYEIRKRHLDATILILEKEADVGFHASGRNSGVLHSGIYYPPQSLKAKVCAAGSVRMAQYCVENNLPIKRIGKVIVPTIMQDDQTIDVLWQRGQANGVNVSIIDSQQLQTIEPMAETASGRALYLPDVSIVDSLAVLRQLVRQLKAQKVEILFNTKVVKISAGESVIYTDNKNFHYGHLYNAAGVYADKIAKQCQVGKHFTLLPFKGSYYQLKSGTTLPIKTLIYPVPNLSMPFLGVHSVSTIQGQIYFGPNAIPALGREHYQGMKGVSISNSVKILHCLFKQYLQDKQNFRDYVHREARQWRKKHFVAAAQQLIPQLQAADIQPSTKMGIRPQLYDQKKHEIVTDFVVESSGNTTHILNAVSPAFTSAFAVAKLVIN